MAPERRGKSVKLTPGDTLRPCLTVMAWVTAVDPGAALPGNRITSEVTLELTTVQAWAPKRTWNPDAVGSKLAPATVMSRPNATGLGDTEVTTGAAA